MKVVDSERKGFAVHLKLVCCKCDHEVGSVYSSQHIQSNKHSPFTINDTMVLFFNRLGLRHTAVKEFCGILGIPAMHLKTFQEKQKRIITKEIEATNDVLRNSAAIVRDMNLVLDPDFPTTEPVPCQFVSFDGTWQKI